MAADQKTVIEKIHTDFEGLLKTVHIDYFLRRIHPELEVRFMAVSSYIKTNQADKLAIAFEHINGVSESLNEFRRNGPDSENYLLTLNDDEPFKMDAFGGNLRFINPFREIEDYLKREGFSLCSPSYLELLDLRVLIHGFLILAKMPEKHRIQWAPICINWIHILRNTALFCRALLESTADTIIISLGSANGDVQQRCPNFAKKLSEKSRVDVLNLDPNFSDNGFMHALSSKNLFVYSYTGLIGSPSLKDKPIMPYEDALQIQRAIQLGIQYLLKWTSKKVILFNHTSPSLVEFFCQIGTEFNQKLGQQLEIIGTSGCFNFPVFVHSAALFQKGSPEQIKQVTAPAWAVVAAAKQSSDGNWSDYGLVQNKSYPQYVKENLLNWQTKFESTIGVLFGSIADIPAEALFKQDNKPKHNTAANPPITPAASLAATNAPSLSTASAGLHPTTADTATKTKATSTTL